MELEDEHGANFRYPVFRKNLLKMLAKARNRAAAASEISVRE